jgi:cell division protein FtsA
MKKPAISSDLLCSLDIGTTKVVTVIAEPGSDDEIRLLGVGCVPSRGLRRGVVINLEQTTQDIERSLQQAEETAGASVHSAWVGVAGEHVKSINSRGAIPISKARSERTGEVTQGDVDRVVEAARAIALPMDRRMLHVLPQEFVVDSERGIRAPVGMAGVRLESNVHIVTCAVSSAQNLLTCCKRAGVQAMDLVLEPPTWRFFITDSSVTRRWWATAETTSRGISPSGCALRWNPPSESRSDTERRTRGRLLRTSFWRFPESGDGHHGK